MWRGGVAELAAASAHRTMHGPAAAAAAASSRSASFFSPIPTSAADLATTLAMSAHDVTPVAVLHGRSLSLPMGSTVMTVSATAHELATNSTTSDIAFSFVLSKGMSAFSPLIDKPKLPSRKKSLTALTSSAANQP
jgi:hypothetical protein